MYTASLTIANNTPQLHVCSLIFNSIYKSYVLLSFQMMHRLRKHVHKSEFTQISPNGHSEFQKCYHGYSQTPRLSHDYAQDCTQLHCLNTLLDLHWIGSDILHSIKYNLCTTIYNFVYRHASRQTCTNVLTIYSNFHTSQNVIYQAIRHDGIK